MKKALFPGSFDPFTTGHASIVARGLQLFDRVVIAIGIHAGKQTLLSEAARLEALRQLYQDEPRVEVATYNGLTIDFAQAQQVDCILRGVRSHQDFEYEMNLADINRQLSGIETVALFTEPQLAAISSSMVRELLRYGRDVTPFLPKGYTL